MGRVVLDFASYSFPCSCVAAAGAGWCPLDLGHMRMRERERATDRQTDGKIIKPLSGGICVTAFQCI